MPVPPAARCWPRFSSRGRRIRMEATVTTKIRALIVDDHEIVIEGMARVLALDGRVDVAWRAGSLAEAEAMAGAIRPDVILVDLRLPDARGYSAVSVVRGLYPDAKLVAITGYGKAASAEAKRLGADAFLTKELASDV